MIGNRRMIWRISMWTQPYGENSCLSHFKLQFILDKTICKTYDQSRINLRSLWINYFGQLKSCQRSDWDRRFVYDWLESTHVEKSSLLCDRAVHIMKCKSYVFADSVLCLGGISVAPIQAWKDKMKWYLETRFLKDLDRVDREPMEFLWKKFPGFTTLGFLAEIQNFAAELKCEPEQFQGRVIFMSMLNDMTWWNTRKWRKLYSDRANSVNVATYAKRFPHGCWSCWGLGCEKVVRNSCQQAKWWVEQNCWSHDAQLRWKRASCISATCALERGEF